MSERHSDKATDTLTVTEAYALEDELYLYEGPLFEDRDELPPAEHGPQCGCLNCNPDDYLDRALELAAGRPSRYPLGAVA